jgi:hypothetical protein
MPISTCNIADWSNNTPFSWPAIGPKKTKAAMVYALAAQLNALGGGDYTDPTDLATAAKDLQPMTDNRLNAALLGVFLRNANAVTPGTVPTDPNEVLTEAAVFFAQGDRTLDQELLFLLCEIGKGTNT